MMRIILSALACILLLPLMLHAQYREQAFGGPSSDYAGHILHTSDGGFIISGNTRSFAPNPRAYAVKLDEQGNFEWQKAYGQGPDRYGRMVVENADGTFTFFSEYETPGGGVTNDDIIMMQLSPDGTLLAETLLPNFSFDVRTCIKTQDGNFVLAGNSGGDSRATKITPTGITLWSYYFGRDENDYFFHGIEDSDNNLVFTGISYKTPHAGDIMTVKLGPDGSLMWEEYTHTDEGVGEYGAHIYELPSGNYQIAGITEVNGDYDICLLELHGYGGVFWDWKVFEEPGNQYSNSFYPLPGGGYIMACSEEEAPGIGIYNASLRKLDQDFNLVWKREYGGANNDFGYDVVILPDTTFALMGNTQTFGNGLSDYYFVIADTDGYVSQSWVNGTVASDENFDCLINNDEEGLSDWLIKAEGINDTLYALTNEYGEYSIALDTGQYVFQVLTPNDYWLACDLTIDVSVAVADTTYVPMPVQPDIDCAALTTSVQAPYLEPCHSSGIKIFYCNDGTIPAEDAYVEVTIDTSVLTAYNSSIPWTVVDADTYSFDLGDIPIDTCAYFHISALLSCDATENATAYVSAHIYPDTSCLSPLVGYDGAFLETTAYCEGDSVRFEINNTGEGDMAAPMDYVVIEDAVLYLSAPVQLTSGNAMEINIETTGATYYLKVPQEPGAPGSNLLTAMVEGCGTDENGQYSVGYANQFPHGDLSNPEDILYQPIVDELPDSKQAAFPEGYGPDHLIEAGTTIEYVLSYQNMTEDTIHQLVFHNELSEYVDLSTLEMRAASHSFDMRLSANGQLSFVLENAAIPPHSIEMGVQCYVSFQVRVPNDLEEGTVLYNVASVQTDFDDFLQLPAYTHTVGSDFVIVSIEEVELPEVQLEVYPNPFREQATIKVGDIHAQQLSLELYDQYGRLVDVQSSAYQSEWTIYRKALLNGTYFFRLLADGEMLATGKLLAF